MNYSVQSMVPQSPDTSLVFVTRLKVRSLRNLPAFLRASLAVAAEAARSHGYAGGRLGLDLSGAFWTLTVWHDEQAMGAFGRSAAHSSAKRHTARWARQASFAGWQRPTRAVPSWREAYDRLAAHGRSSLPDPVLVDPLRRPRTIAIIRPWPWRRSSGTARDAAADS